MRVIAKEIKSVKLLPGDLYSTVNQEYWNVSHKGAVGERVYIRTENACPESQKNIPVYKLMIKRRG